jgi:hypothetical protein
MRILQILVLLVLANSFVNAQACGWTKLTIYLTDSTGNIVKNGLFETFDKDFKNRRYFHGSEKEWISWSENKQAYFGTEGMCGGHRDVGVRITAKGFEKFDFVTDLPLGWTSYEIKLKRESFDEIAGKIKLQRVIGKTVDSTGNPIPNVNVTFYNKNNKIRETKSDLKGIYTVDLTKGEYDIEFRADGFKITKVNNYKVEENNNSVIFDVQLYVSDNVIGCPLPEPEKKPKKE